MTPPNKRRIELVPPNPDWKSIFEKEARKLGKIFSNQLAIHHIGSTAIESIKAKPVIDILLVLDDISVAERCLEKLEKLNYSYRGENGLPGRKYFEKGSPDHTHHLHVFEDGNKEIDRHLMFRDYLNTHRKEAKAYSALKEKLATEYRMDPEGYTKAKSKFISEIERKARDWKT